MRLAPSLDGIPECSHRVIEKSDRLIQIDVALVVVLPLPLFDLFDKIYIGRKDIDFAIDWALAVRYALEPVDLSMYAPSP